MHNTYALEMHSKAQICKHNMVPAACFTEALVGGPELL